MKLYKNKCGMRYKKYQWELFWSKAPKGQCSFMLITKQDTAFFNSKENYSWVIFYDRIGKKIFEGPLVSGFIQGKVTYYYRSGRIKKIEDYGFEGKDYWDGDFKWSDAPYERGSWTYYKRSGRMYKRTDYLTLIRPADQERYRISHTSFFDKKMEVKKEVTNMLGYP